MGLEDSSAIFSDGTFCFRLLMKPPILSILSSTNVLFFKVQGKRTTVRLHEDVEGNKKQPNLYTLDITRRIQSVTLSVD